MSKNNKKILSVKPAELHTNQKLINKKIADLEDKLFSNLRINLSKISDPEESYQRAIKSIKESHILGQQYFDECSFDKAEQKFVKALKPILSKPECKI